MIEREELFERFLDCLHTNETPPEYLGKEPDDVTPFDPYQMVGEWIALRHEVKQQGKLLQSAQSAWQKAMDAAQTDKEQLQTLLKETTQQADARYSEGLAAQKARFEKEQEGWLRDMLGIVDALDHACAHWQAAEVETMPPENKDDSSAQKEKTLAQILKRWLAQIGWQGQQVSQGQRNYSLAATESNLVEILRSSRAGVELIRRMLLELLRQRQVVPIEAEGQQFNPALMYAVDRQESNEAVDNTVAREVVRGYLWNGRVLREAQVIVFSSIPARD